MGFRLRGVRLSFDFCCPPSTGIRRPAKYGTPARRAISPKRRECDPLIFAALRAQRFAIWRSLGRLRGVRFRLPGEISFIDFCCPPGTRFAARRSLGRLRVAGKVGPVMGLRPLLGPPCIPPEAPPKRSFNYRKTTRARVLCCGSFPPSLRSLR